jgi:hypothetical protein
MNARSRRELCLNRVQEKKGTKLWKPSERQTLSQRRPRHRVLRRTFCSIEFGIADFVPGYLTMTKNNFYSDRTVTYTTGENRVRPARGRRHSTRP